MAKKIEQLLRLVADMEKFSKEFQQDTGKHSSLELSFEELDLVAAAQSNIAPPKDLDP